MLATLYSDHHRAIQVVQQAGLNELAIDFTGSALIIWWNILTEARKAPDGIDKLFQVALREYSESQDLQAIYQAYRQNPTAVIGEWLPNATDFVPVNLLRSAQKLTPLEFQPILSQHLLIRRTTVNSELDHFFASADRSTLLVGASGVGKSVILAWQARKLLEEGWAVFLIDGSAFTLDTVAAYIVKTGLGYTGTLDWRRVLIAPWQSTLPEQVKGIVLLIDDLFTLMDIDRTISELKQLHTASRQVPSSVFKLLVACHESWEVERLSFLVNAQTAVSTSDVTAKLIRVADFTIAELADALRSIRAEELLQTRPPGELPDPHVENLLDLLKHPSIWGLYARSFNEGERLATAEMGWNYLLNKYLSSMLHKAQQRCGYSADLLREQLMQFAQIARMQHVHDFRLPRSELRTNLPNLQVDTIDPTISPYAALRELGVFLESAEAEHSEIRFAFSDLGTYLLSFVLERESQQQDQSASALTATVQSWLNEVYNYAPLMDAMLILVDRLAANPRNPILQCLLTNLIESHTVRVEIALRPIQPAILLAIFEIAAQKELELLYHYKKAVSALRATPETIQKARDYLFDRRNRQVQQLAACFLGANRDSSCITELVDLLEEDDKTLRDDVNNTLAQIGEPAIPFLLAVSSDRTKAMSWRIHCLGALWVIRVRTPQISTVLTACLRESTKTGNTKLLNNALLTAAALRDQAQVAFAIEALAFPDWEVVGNAAKLLKETPFPAAAPALEATLQRIKLAREHTSRQDIAAKQTLAALLAMNTSQTRTLVLHYLQESVHGVGILPAMRAIGTIEEWNLPELAGELLQSFVQTICGTMADTTAYLTLKQFEKIWQPEGMAALVQANTYLQQQGTNIARLLVDAVIASEEPDRQHMLYDHQVRVAGLHMLAKCQPTKWVDEVVRLLACPGRSHFDLHVCDALWIVGDERAEPALLQKLEQSASDNAQSYELSRILRALGTCATQQAVPIILEHIKNAESLGPNIAEECLCPLLYRNTMQPDQFMILAQNGQATPASRAASVVALGILDANAYARLFADLLTVDAPILQAYAARMLGFAEQPIFVPALRRLLKRTRDAFVAEQAAFALGKLGALDSVIDIERAFKAFSHTGRTLGFIDALELLHQPSSVELLLDIVEHRRFGHTEYAIIEALGAFWFDSRARQKVTSWLESWHGGYTDSGRQTISVRTLARHAPDFLLDQVSRLYDTGKLHKSARRALARSLATLWRMPELNSIALKALSKRCICDLDFGVRTVAGQALAGTDATFCQQIFDELYSTTSDPTV
jgi:HEAT repeat protein